MIIGAAEQAIERFNRSRGARELTLEAVRSEILAAYLSGGLQMAEFFAKNDGSAVTPQLVCKAYGIVSLHFTQNLEIGPSMGEGPPYIPTRDSFGQLYHRGDVVEVAEEPNRSYHGTAIVMGSYKDQCSGDNVKSYTLMFLKDGNQVSWFDEGVLTFVRHGNEQEILAVKEARAARDAAASDIKWIFDNWAGWVATNTNFPGPSIEELARRIGITNMWGSHGEGITYYGNAIRVARLVCAIHPQCATLEEFEAKLEEIKQQRANAEKDPD